jgi:hypothetical protein
LYKLQWLFEEDDVSVEEKDFKKMKKKVRQC